ncbi:hypothetical protein KFK09_009611 [Dendrobium nobile]|uniref:Uncharacterized protein n=1 Tax=Dendrobium nobile TaxID=94219 RepID=A0A8T3BHY4_DENNO|nr:hypothetical protein KFK09_009611 [Dendrobium nobile]
MGYSYILAAIDSFLKWEEAAPFREVTFDYVINFFTHNFVYKFGVPRYIILDNGTSSLILIPTLKSKPSSLASFRELPQAEFLSSRSHPSEDQPQFDLIECIKLFHSQASILFLGEGFIYHEFAFFEIIDEGLPPIVSFINIKRLEHSITNSYCLSEAFSSTLKGIYSGGEDQSWWSAEVSRGVRSQEGRLGCRPERGQVYNRRIQAEIVGCDVNSAELTGSGRAVVRRKARMGSGRGGGRWSGGRRRGAAGRVSGDRRRLVVGGRRRGRCLCRRRRPGGGLTTGGRRQPGGGSAKGGGRCPAVERRPGGGPGAGGGRGLSNGRRRPCRNSEILGSLDSSRRDAQFDYKHAIFGYHFLSNNASTLPNVVRAPDLDPFGLGLDQFWCSLRVKSAEKAQKLRKGLWSPDEDEKLFNHVIRFGIGCWSLVPKRAGLQRCGKSCRLRWINYLRADLKRGSFSQDEEDLIISLRQVLGNSDEDIDIHLSKEIRFSADILVKCEKIERFSALHLESVESTGSLPTLGSVNSGKVLCQHLESVNSGRYPTLGRV